MGKEARTWRRRAIGHTCYLCGQPIRDGEAIDRDHVPAKSFVPTKIRQTYPLQLHRLPVHVSCNHGIKLDEEYFLAALGPAAADDQLVGRPLWEELRQAYATDSRRKLLGEMVLSGMGRVQLPDGSRVFEYDGGRARRVIWKVVRGLAFIETDGALLLPDDTRVMFEIFPTADDLTARRPDWLDDILGGPSLGRYGAVLDYRVHSLVEFKNGRLSLAGQGWALLFWNRVIAIAVFHLPVCPCDDCMNAREGAAPGMT